MWRAGKTAGALRTAASSALLAILEGNLIGTELLLEMGPKLVPSLLSLLEDDSPMTRHIACQSVQVVIRSSNRKLGPDLLHKMYPGELRFAILYCSVFPLLMMVNGIRSNVEAFGRRE